MTGEERRRIVEERRRRHLPWHTPPHLEVAGEISYLISASCYDHLPIAGQTPERMSECEEGVLEAFRERGARVYAWCILPNHYHVLARTGDIKALLKRLGQFHGRSSFTWNGQDNQRGRHYWYNAFDRYIRSDRHFFASLNYVHNNPVHHGYVDKWFDWPGPARLNILSKLDEKRQFVSGENIRSLITAKSGTSTRETHRIRVGGEGTPTLALVHGVQALACSFVS